MLLAIKHKRLGNTIIAFTHKCLFYLILDIFNFYVIMNIQMTEHLRNRSKI